MKRVLIILFIFISIKSFGQLPNTLPQGSEGLEWWQRGITGADLGIRWRLSFADTTAANNYKSGLLKNISGFVIRVVDDYWSRSNDLTKWNKINGGVGGGSPNTSVGIGYPLAITGTNDVKKIRDSTGIAIDSSVSNTLRITNTLPGKTTVLDEVTDISVFSESTTSNLVVKDSTRGGPFSIYEGSDAVDNGMIFDDALGRKWKRVTYDDKINMLWYGARQDGTVACRPLFLAALSYAYNHPSFREIHFPYDSIGSPAANVYLFSDSVLIDRNIRITGEGSIWYPKSKLYFPAGKSGFVFRINYGESNFGVSLENLSFTQETSATDNTSAIKAYTQVHLKNIEVYDFAGHGILISACATPTTGDNDNYGNASNSILEFVSSYNNDKNGIHTEGCDANTIDFRDINVTQNKRWGLFNNGFLGDFISKPHAAFNGVPAVGGNSVVSYGGLYYSAKPGFDGYFEDAADSNYNKQPDISPTYWYEVTAMTSNVWNDSTRYYSGGAICIKNDNAWTNIINAYTEAFQPPIYLNARSKVDGGDNGAGVSNGVFKDMFQGYEYFRNGSMVIQDGQLGINTDPNASTKLHIKTDANETVAAILEGYNTISSLQFRNSGGIRSEFDYIGTDFQWYIGNTPVLAATLNTTTFNPGVHNTSDLGSTALYWNDLFAVNGNFGKAGTLLGVINLAGNTSGTVTLQPAAAAGTYTLTLPTDDGTTANQALVSDASGVTSWGAVVLSGTYTPTLTNVANVSASTPYSCQYSRVGNMVTVTGEVDIDPTTTLTLTQLGISLPIASALTASNELAGASGDDLGTAARVAGDFTNDRAEIRMTPVDVTNRRFSFTFTYRVL